MRIGIDLGGTKIEVIALDEQGETLVRERVSTPRGDYQATLDAIEQLVSMAEQKAGCRGSVGIGIPGTISPLTGRVKNANSTWLNGQDLQGDLERQLGRAVRIANDANCFTVSEAIDGAAKGAGVVFGVIIGTGCGGGVAINGHAHNGGNGVAGEWGHNPLPRISLDELEQCGGCYCGQRGCIEQFISGTGFTRQYNQQAGLSPEQALKGAEIIDLMRAGDTLACHCFEQFLDQLARALAHLVGVLDPEVIVLGGGLSNVDEIYPALERRLPDWIFGGECTTPVRKAVHGDSSGVRGAAWLWN